MRNKGTVGTQTIEALLVTANETESRTISRMVVHACHEGLSKLGSVRILHAPSIAGAMKMLLSDQFDIVLLDAHLPDSCGIEGIVAVRSAAPEIPILVLSGARHHQRENEAIAAGAQDFLLKRELNGEGILRSMEYAIARMKTVKKLSSDLEARETSLEVQDAFLFTMQQELCRPLTTIVGFTEMLLSEKLPATMRRSMVETIQRNSNYLLRLIKSSADLSQLKSGMLPVEVVQTSATKILSEVDRKMRRKALDKGLSLHVAHSTPIPEMVLTDPERLQQILFYLLSTAIELAQQGEIMVDVSCDVDLSQCIFQIRYSGIGLHPRGENELLRSEFQEVSLELFLAQELAERLGGSLKVTSEEDLKQVFQVSIDTGPLDSVQMIGANTSATNTLETNDYPHFNGNVLIAEDCPDTQQLLSYLLAKCGVNVSVVQDGKEAVKRARSEKFDLVILSGQLPGLDGISVATLLRQKGYTAPIIAFSGLMNKNQTKTASLFTDYLRKPFTKTELFSLLGRYLEENPEDQETPVLDTLLVDTPKYPM